MRHVPKASGGQKQCQGLQMMLARGQAWGYVSNDRGAFGQRRRRHVLDTALAQHLQPGRLTAGEDQGYQAGRCGFSWSRGPNRTQVARPDRLSWTSSFCPAGPSTPSSRLSVSLSASPQASSPWSFFLYKGQFRKTNDINRILFFLSFFKKLYPC